jgi:hypothetical protein
MGLGSVPGVVTGSGVVLVEQVRAGVRPATTAGPGERRA